jgi:hypothetical protein
LLRAFCFVTDGRQEEREKGKRRVSGNKQKFPYKVTHIIFPYAVEEKKIPDVYRKIKILIFTEKVRNIQYFSNSVAKKIRSSIVI